MFLVFLVDDHDTDFEIEGSDEEEQVNEGEPRYAEVKLL